MRVEATTPSGLVEGRGQGHPGPSTFTRPLKPGGRLLVAVVVVLAAVAQFLLGLELIEHGERVPTAAAVALVVGLLLLAVGRRGAEAFRLLPSTGGFIGGAILGGAVPLVYVMNQYSDAPSGTLVLFWTTVLPGALLVVAGAWLNGVRRLALAASLALLATFSAAGVLGNWERPSSFSLLAKHVPEQLALAGGSALFVAVVAALAWLGRAYGWRFVALFAGGGSILAGFGLIALSDDPSGAFNAVLSPLTLMFALAYALVTLGSLFALVRGSGAAPGAGLAIVPSAMSLLIFVEAARGAFGPEPILRAPVAWSSAAALAALLAAAVAESWREAHAAGTQSDLAGGAAEAHRSLSERPVPCANTKVLSVLRVAAPAGTVLAGVGMAVAALDVSVQGRYTDAARFSANFVMRGWETVGGWMALAMTLVVVALVMVRRAPIVQVLAGIAVAVAALTWKVAGTTPLHTWVTWVPAEVQQDYGTEYARIAFAPAAVWFQMAAVAVAIAVALFAIFDGVMRLRRAGTGPAEESESL